MLRSVLAKAVNRPAVPILVLALAARLPGLSSKPLWYDEAFSVLFSETGPTGMAYGTLAVEHGVAADVHPLAYYTLLWGWMAALGQSGLAVRSLSVIIGLAVVYAGYRFARRFTGERTAAVAGLALAVAPFQIHYSQEVRMYAMMALLLVGATLAYRRATESDGLRFWAIFAVLAALAQYTHTLSAFYLVALGLSPLWERRWRQVRRVGIASLAALVLYLPWLLYLPSQFSRLRWAYWIPQPGAAELVRTWIVFVGGLPVPGLALAPVLSATVLGTAFAALGMLRARRAADFDRGAWLLYLSVAPPLLMFAFSYWQPVYLERGLLASGAMFLLWLAWGLGRHELGAAYRWTGIVALAGGMLLGLFSYYSYRGFPYAPFAELNAFLADRPSDESVIHSNKITALPAIYYDRAADHAYLADPPGTGSDTLAPATQRVLGLLAEPGMDTAAGESADLWFVMFAREEDDYRSLGYDPHPALGWLESNYRHVATVEFEDLRAFHFVQ